MNHKEAVEQYDSTVDDQKSVGVECKEPTYHDVAQSVVYEPISEIIDRVEEHHKLADKIYEQPVEHHDPEAECHVVHVEHNDQDISFEKQNVDLQENSAVHSKSTTDDGGPTIEHEIQIHQYAELTEHYQPGLAHCESSTQRIPPAEEQHDLPVEHDQQNVQHDEAVDGQYELPVQADQPVVHHIHDALPHQDFLAHHHKQAVEHEDAIGHEQPVFDQHENCSARPPHAAEDQVSSNEDEVHLYHEDHEYQQPTAAGKLP